MTNTEYRTVVLKRHNGPDWVFNWDAEFDGLVHRTTKNVYKLFFENIATAYKPIWIGRLAYADDARYWYTQEHEIGAQSLEVWGCSIVFKRER